MKRAGPIVVVFIIQVACAFFFVSDILASVLGIRTTPISWQMRELLEVGASVGLVMGVFLGGVMLRRVLIQRNAAEERLRRASGAFLDLLEERFAEWGLTTAERDVALFAIKGMSTAEIAALRSTSEGTVKAQTNAIYRKAGVTGRPQLLSLFIDDLMREDGSVRAAANRSRTAA
ncbi:MAG: helix-turn-helix transcriptional regulator [Tabrizicola sp.]|uniref:helix-turn-helix transcriptional regulator n=1 Tax=Tabrizicola sp. TaxID=2005166 RepID=UPI0027328D25|nr:helix-turn-helix transcriptional regulator [Tabrizicola sp.]MDP3261510.1 helix-turn-helix transcriptional regulator [Tabrizicola sp.]MDP3649299.1 helix-turn-helix transcriptional regulator [Paracoccaceae bacterium]MDZ4068921.1 helix-turn-helix transcriptional regulator [Tabrizicola sp.]